MFAGGDQSYLRDVQYRDGRQLDARAHLHVSDATTSTTFPQFESAVRSRFIDGRMRIRTRAGVFVCRSPRAVAAG